MRAVLSMVACASAMSAYGEVPKGIPVSSPNRQSASALATPTGRFTVPRVDGWSYQDGMGKIVAKAFGNTATMVAAFNGALVTIQRLNFTYATACPSGTCDQSQRVYGAGYSWQNETLYYESLDCAGTPMVRVFSNGPEYYPATPLFAVSHSESGVPYLAIAKTADLRWRVYQSIFQDGYGCHASSDSDLLAPIQSTVPASSFGVAPFTLR
jgi:hypothetical protein